MTVLVSFILLFDHPFELLDPVRGDGIAHLTDSLNHIYGQYIAYFRVAFFFLIAIFGIFLIFLIFAAMSWPGYIHEV